MTFATIAKSARPTDKACLYTEWLTPPRVLTCVRAYFGGPIPLDPCTSEDNPTNAISFFTDHPYSRNGLIANWGKPCFVNPPYGRVLPQWIAKASSEASFHTEILLLIPSNRFETKYGQELLNNPTVTAICFLRGRVAFIGRDGKPAGANPYGSLLWGFNTPPSAFAAAFAPLGACLFPAKVQKEAP
jgi:site-specific DNA-methyltransferase (adenine-specific)